MKVLMIAPQPFFTPRGTPFSVYYRTLAMAEQGVEIDLLTYGLGDDVEIVGLRIIRIPHPRFLGSVAVGPSWLKALLDVPLFLYTVALSISSRYDVIHAHEEAALFGLLLRPLFKYRFVYDMHSSLPQQLSNFRYTRSRAMTAAFQWLEDRCLASADVVVTICPALADYAMRRMPKPERHLLIENSMIEGVHATQRQRRRGSEESKQPKKPMDGILLPARRPVVAYAGTFEAYQGLDLLLQAFARVKKERQDAFLFMVGGTDEQVSGYQSLAGDLGLTGEILILPRTDQASVRRYLMHASVQVSSRVEGTNTPLKVYEQLASGIPLVATRILAHTQVLTDDLCTLVDADPDAMADGILSVLGNPSTAEQKAKRARAIYEQLYSRPAYFRKIEELLQLIGKERHADRVAAALQ